MVGAEHTQRIDERRGQRRVSAPRIERGADEARDCLGVLVGGVVRNGGKPVQDEVGGAGAGKGYPQCRL